IVDAPLALTNDEDEAPADCFRGAVGRVRPGGFVRVVVASEGALPVRDGKAAYRFTLPACKLEDLSFSLQADEALAKGASFASAAEDPKRFELSLRLLKAILGHDRDLKHFNVLTFSTGAAWMEPAGWLPNTKEVRDKVLPRLADAAPEGATDLSAALEAVAKPA